jgi:hypothetical protein
MTFRVTSGLLAALACVFYSCQVVQPSGVAAAASPPVSEQLGASTVGSHASSLWERVRTVRSGSYAKRMVTVADVDEDGYDDIVVASVDEKEDGGRAVLELISSYTGDLRSRFTYPGEASSDLEFVDICSTLQDGSSLVLALAKSTAVNSKTGDWGDRLELLILDLQLGRWVAKKVLTFDSSTLASCSVSCAKVCRDGDTVVCLVTFRGNDSDASTFQRVMFTRTRSESLEVLQEIQFPFWIQRAIVVGGSSSLDPHSLVVATWSVSGESGVVALEYDSLRPRWTRTTSELNRDWMEYGGLDVHDESHIWLGDLRDSCGRIELVEVQTGETQLSIPPPKGLRRFGQRITTDPKRRDLVFASGRTGADSFLVTLRTHDSKHWVAQVDGNQREGHSRNHASNYPRLPLIIFGQNREAMLVVGADWQGFYGPPPEARITLSATLARYSF